MTHMMGAASSRIRFGDTRQEGQQELDGRPPIVSPHFRCRRHQ